jgi:hypothetical protein
MSSYKLHAYAGLAANKKVLNAAFDSAGTPAPLRTLFLAMAMLETTTLSSAQRDDSKDSQGVCANVSLFNLSIDLVRYLGYRGDPWGLNAASALPEVVRLLRAGVDKYGRDRLLNFVRGGRTAFNDGHSYGAAEYRRTIATIEGVLARDPSLAWDDRRVEVYLCHV